jgi:hypothetical protein
MSSPKRPDTMPAWTTRPAEPSGYGPLARLSDMFHGWYDGKRRIPLLVAGEPSDGATPDGTTSEDESPGEETPEAVSVHEAANELRVWTPRIEVLGREARQAIAREKRSLDEAQAGVAKRLGKARAEKQTLEEKIKLAEEDLGLARRPQPEEERTTRRLAERDSRTHPDAFVRQRRQAEHARKLAKAQRGYLALIARHAEVSESEEALREAINRRNSAAQAAAWQHYERGQRRIATYLQQLVRSRKREGPRLNQIIPLHPVGPDLPSWLGEPTPLAEPGHDEGHDPADQSGSGTGGSS